MDAIAWVGAAVGAALLLAGSVWAWWRHRARLLEMQRRLAWNEQSRFELERHTQELDLRLASMAQLLKSLESTRGLDRTLKRGDALAADRPEPARTWKDTEPLPDDANPFADTQPMGLDRDDGTAPPAVARRPPVRP